MGLGDSRPSRELGLSVEARIAVHSVGNITRKCLTYLFFSHAGIVARHGIHMGLAFIRQICILRFMDTQQIIERLANCNRAVVSRETGIGYTYLNRLVWGHIKDPGASKIDKLRDYFEQQARETRPQ